MTMMTYMLKKRKIIFLPLGGNTTPCLAIKPLQFPPNPPLYSQFSVLQKSSTPSNGLTSQSMRCLCLSILPFLIVLFILQDSQFNSTLSTRSLFFSQHPSHSLGTPNISCPCFQLIIYFLALLCNC